MIKTANFSKDRKHRYALYRIWDSSKGSAMFIGLNPSTADETTNDPTVRRCIRFAKDWGYGGMIMSNIFAYRATQPKDMKAASDPIGPKNDEWLVKLSGEASIIVGAWGNHGSFMGRGDDVIKLISNIHYLKLNKSGSPSHPLYLPASLKPKPMVQYATASEVDEISEYVFDKNKELYRRLAKDKL